MAAHLRHRDIPVPIRDWPVAVERLKPYALKAEGRGNHHRQRRAVEVDDVRAVENVEARIVFAWSPTQEWSLVRDGGRQRDDRSRVQRRVRPAIATSADAGCERIVDS